MQIVNMRWLTALRRIRQQHRLLILFHFIFSHSPDHLTHANPRSLKKYANNGSIKNLAAVNCEALHLRFVLDNVEWVGADSQTGPCPISVVCDSVTW